MRKLILILALSIGLFSCTDDYEDTIEVVKLDCTYTETTRTENGYFTVPEYGEWLPEVAPSNTATFVQTRSVTETTTETESVITTYTPNNFTCENKAPTRVHSQIGSTTAISELTRIATNSNYIANQAQTNASEEDTLVTPVWTATNEGFYNFGLGYSGGSLGAGTASTINRIYHIQPGKIRAYYVSHGPGKPNCFEDLWFRPTIIEETENYIVMQVGNDWKTKTQYRLYRSGANQDALRYDTRGMVQRTNEFNGTITFEWGEWSNGGGLLAWDNGRAQEIVNNIGFNTCDYNWDYGSIDGCSIEMGLTKKTFGKTPLQNHGWDTEYVYAQHDNNPEDIISIELQYRDGSNKWETFYHHDLEYKIMSDRIRAHFYEPLNSSPIMRFKVETTCGVVYTQPNGKIK